MPSSKDMNETGKGCCERGKNVLIGDVKPKVVPEFGSCEKMTTIKESEKKNQKNRDEKASYIEERSQNNQEEINGKSNRTYFSLLLLMTLLSVATRLYEIQTPAHICWDETHFGKMGSWYIKREFFFDVHPPLGKMLIGLFGKLTGYDGEFPFSKPGDEYGETKYVGMRMCCGLMGAALPSLAYMCVWHLTNSLLASLLSSLLIILDVGTLTLSRHILLDPILMFFIMMATYCQLKFLSYSQRSFSFFWWFWLTSTGIFLAASIGVKFVGLFIILFLGYTTVSDLWKLLGNHVLPMSIIIKHFLARAACLIVIPISVYMIIFAIHFKVLNHSGNGDGFYSSAFQSQLIGNKLYNVSMPEYIAFGSVITLKQRKTAGAYLHSHWHLYPEDHPPRQQQVTTYAHKDYNNLWRIKTADREPEEGEEPINVVSGDLVRLEHVVTRRNLHSHKEPAPLSKKHFQVSCYGMNGTGDANDVWIVDVMGHPLGTPIRTASSKIRFIHYHVRCVLFSHDKKLPKWGFEQSEATCNPNVKESKAVWSVEEVTDTRLPNASFEIYSPSFAEKIIESHAVMTQSNSGLKPKEGEITSRPWQWPINYRGQIFSGKDHRIYLLGNPIIFWMCLLALVVFLVYFLIHAVRVQRGMKENENWRVHKEKIFGACWWLFLGWALHYLPFWPMTRVLYFHHYFPAFLYSAMLAGIILDYSLTLLVITIPEHWAMPVFHVGIGTLVAGLTYSFYLFHPLTYGMSGPLAQYQGSTMYGLKWLSSWDI